MGGGRGGVQRCASNFSLVTTKLKIREKTYAYFVLSNLQCSCIDVASAPVQREHGNWEVGETVRQIKQNNKSIVI